MKKSLTLVAVIIVIIVMSVFSHYVNSNNGKQVQVEILSNRIIRSSLPASGKLVHAEQVRLTTEKIGKI